jgi:uncharacterized protein
LTSALGNHTVTVVNTPDAASRPPAWRPVLIVSAVLLAFARMAALSVPMESAHPPRMEVYLAAIATQAIVLAFVFWAHRRPGRTVTELIGGKPGPAGWGRDLLVAVLAWPALTILLTVLKMVIAAPPPAVAGLLPRTHTEIALWIALSVTAGVAEELLYRGSLQARVTALTRSPAAGILWQGVLFGICHGYQGWPAILTTGAYGLLLGVLAWWRGSLRPGMIMHAWEDLVSGLAPGLF